MRLIYKVFLCSFVVFSLVKPVMAQEVVTQEPEVTPSEQPVTKSFSDYGADLKRAMFGRRASDFRRPYLHDASKPNFEQAIDEDWRPEYWADDKGGVQEVLDGFYRAGIIKGQYDNDKVPVLEVGKPFLRLSPPDQRHVIEFVDYAHKITESKKHGIFYIVLEDHENELLGIYSENGVQFQ